MIYYIKPDGGTGDGQSIGTAWTIAHYNSTGKASVVAGDTVRIYANGTVYPGGLSLQNSGTAGNPITFETYGGGVKPRISGLIEISPTSDDGQGVKYTSLPGLPSMQVVTVNDQIKPMGRFPRFDWLQINSHSGSLQITDNDLPDSPSFVGAELVRRDQRYIVNRFTVTSQSGGVVNMSTDNWGMGGNGGVPLDLNGYFFQNHRNALDFDYNTQVQFGDWYYNQPGGVFYMYFGDELPGSHVVKVSNTAITLNIAFKSYLVFKDLIFEGGTLYTMLGSYCNHITFNNCEWRNNGGFAAHVSLSTYIDLINCKVERSTANGFYLVESDYCTVNGQYVNDTATQVGMGNNGDGNGNGFVIYGTGNNVYNIQVWNSGYCGIQYGGLNFYMKGFYVNTYCMNKDDGGGIYIYDSQELNRVVEDGIILNGQSALEGGRGDTSALFGKAAGIYFDDHVEHVSVNRVLVANCSGEGCFVHGAKNLEIHNCIFYNNRVQMYYNEWLAGLIVNVNRSNNMYIAANSGQLVEFFHIFADYTDFATFGTSNNNVYATPYNLTAKKVRLLYDQMEPEIDLTLAEWVDETGRDTLSIDSAVEDTGEESVKIDVNDTAINKFIPITGKEYRDAEGNVFGYPGYTLDPFTGKVLFFYQTVDPGTGEYLYYTIDGKFAKKITGEFYVKEI